MTRFALFLILAGNVLAAESAVDIDTAAKIYQQAAVRDQVRASLVTMPKQIRDMFSRDSAAHLDTEQLSAVDAAAVRGFRIDVFEAPALAALAASLDTATVAKTQAFLQTDLGKRMVADDVASATMGEANIDKVMSGEVSTPLTPKRAALIDKLEQATRSTESTVEIFLSMGQAVALGTAIGSGLDQQSVAERAHKSGEASRAGLEQDMRRPMQRFLAYSYKDLSDSDLKHLLRFLESPPGTRFVNAYNAAMQAGYEAMGKRTGEELGESLRELAQASVAMPAESEVPEGLAAPGPAAPGPAAPGPAAPGPAPPAPSVPPASPQR